MKQFSEKSPSQLPFRNSRGKVLTIIISSLLAVAVALGIIGSYAWFVGNTDDVKLAVDSEGLNIEARLWYVNSVTPANEPAETDYTVEQSVFNDKRTVQDKFYAGSELAYRIVITNNTNVLNGAQPPVQAGHNIDVKLSFDSLNQYFYDMVNDYLSQASLTESEIKARIRDNSGIMLMKLNYVRYAVYNKTNDGSVPNNLEKTDYWTLDKFAGINKANNTVVRDYGDNQYFFELEDLMPGQSVSVYFSIICVQPYLASDSYSAFRESQAAAETDTVRAATFRHIFGKELESIVIIKGSDTSVAALTFNVKKFCVYARTSE